VFPADKKRKVKKKDGDDDDGQRLYLEITKGESTPAEALNLRKRQSRAVKCSAVRGEPVYQVRERV
jgi:hypothetical protein